MEWRLEIQAERLVGRGRGFGYRSEPTGEVPFGEDSMPPRPILLE